MENQNKNVDLSDVTNILILLLIVFYIFYIGASIIIPFLISLLLAFIIIALYDFFLKLKIPKFFAILFSILTYVLFFWFIIALLKSNINELIEFVPLFQQYFSEFIANISLPETLNISKFIDSFDMQGMVTSMISSITSVLGNTGLILLYVAFILFEYRFFRRKIYIIVHNMRNKKIIINAYDKIKLEVKSYFFVKFWISLVSALVSYLIMLFFGLKFSTFWAVLIFILNFIPNIGSLIAISMPSILSFVQPGIVFTDSIIMIVLLVLLDQFMGNIVEPKFLGNRLNLSPIVIILGLVFWGVIWGPVGMFLSVPIMVIINIIFSVFDSTRPIAILFSEKGDLPIISGRWHGKSHLKVNK